MQIRNIEQTMRLYYVRMKISTGIGFLLNPMLSVLLTLSPLRLDNVLLLLWDLLIPLVGD